jgi:hypothetical protein
LVQKLWKKLVQKALNHKTLICVSILGSAQCFINWWWANQNGSLNKKLKDRGYQNSTLAKTYGIKVWCYWEHLRNTLRTKKNIKFLYPPPKPKWKKLSTPKCMLSLLIGCMKFLFF